MGNRMNDEQERLNDNNQTEVVPAVGTTDVVVETAKESVESAEKVTMQGVETDQSELQKSVADESVKTSDDAAKGGGKVRRKFPTWVDFFAAIGVFTLSLIVASFVMLFMLKNAGEERSSAQITFITYVIQFMPVVAFIVWQRLKAGRDSGIHFGVRRASLPILLWGVVLIVASGIVIEPLLALFPTEGYDAVKGTIGLGGWAILSTVVAAPILEEALFRGVIFETCRESFGSAVAVFGSALLFGVIHIVPVQVVNAFVVGLILSYIYLRTRSLVAVILLHAINNTIAYATMALFGESGQMTLAELIPTRWLYWTIYGLSALVFLYAMVRLWRSLRDNTELA